MVETGAECDDGTIVAALFMEIGIRPSLQGYDYLKEAVLLYIRMEVFIKPQRILFICQKSFS